MTRQDARQQSAEQASKPQSGERLAHPTEGQSKAESKAHVSSLQQAPLNGLYSANFRSLTGSEDCSRRLTSAPTAIGRCSARSTEIPLCLCSGGRDPGNRICIDTDHCFINRPSNTHAHKRQQKKTRI